MGLSRRAGFDDRICSCTWRICSGATDLHSARKEKAADIRVISELMTFGGSGWLSRDRGVNVPTIVSQDQTAAYRLSLYFQAIPSNLSFKHFSDRHAYRHDGHR